MSKIFSSIKDQLLWWRFHISLTHILSVTVKLCESVTLGKSKMEKQRAQHFYDDLCGIYQQEISSLSAEIEALRQKNHELQLQAEITAKKNAKGVIHVKLEELMLQTPEATAQEKRGETVEGLLQQLEPEEVMLTAELAVARQQLTDLNQQLEAEKHLRMQVEVDKLEAVEIADILFGTIENMKEEGLAQLKSEKSKQDELHHEIMKLRQTLRKEEEQRALVEADAMFCCKNIDFHCQLQIEEKLRMEMEESRREAVGISRALFQSLEEALTVTTKLETEIQTFNDRLRQAGKDQENVAEDFKELTLALEREAALRIQSESYELEAYEVVDYLQKQIRKITAGRI